MPAPSIKLKTDKLNYRKNRRIRTLIGQKVTKVRNHLLSEPRLGEDFTFQDALALNSDGRGVRNYWDNDVLISAL